jgi:hypothetical protein
METTTAVAEAATEVEEATEAEAEAETEVAEDLMEVAAEDMPKSSMPMMLTTMTTI